MLSDIPNLTGYLNRDLPCSCGRCHRTPLTAIEIGPHAASELSHLIRSSGYRNPLIIADRNTWRAAGETIADCLEREGITFRTHLLKSEEVHPDEYSAGSVLMAYTQDIDLFIAVGSGSINDITRFVSFQLKLPYFIFGTAPSMDGFASNVAAMTTNNMKVTYPSHTPVAIFADPAILAAAPTELIRSGFGDILGKYTCLAEWKLSSIINDEYYCPEIAGLTAKARDLTVNSRAGLKCRDENALVSLTEALILSGIAMSFSGNSRPASGSEHHLSHYWEMKYLAEGKKAVLHGIKVGIGTVVSLRLYELLRGIEPDFESISLRTPQATDDAWEREMRRAFGPAAEEVIALERSTGKNSYENWKKRFDRIREVWPELRSVIDLLPAPSVAENYLREVGCPTAPSEIGLDRQTVFDSILYAKEVRDRYTVLQLLWDLGLLEEFAVRTADALF